jgi:hypothetical protein
VSRRKTLATIDPDELHDQAHLEAELIQGDEAAIRYPTGDEWLDETLDRNDQSAMSERTDGYDPTGEVQADRPQPDQLASNERVPTRGALTPQHPSSAAVPWRNTGATPTSSP